MAWSWRKRRTLFPGVRVNFSKKGISTTVGPRGASMTFGPNGTYLNTSIPGTGLYNRRKISNSQSSANMNSNTNDGCSTIAVRFVSFSVWVCLALIIVVSFFLFDDTKYWWLFLAFIAVAMITHIIVHNANSKDAEDKPIQQPTESRPQDIPTSDSTPSDNINEITSDYLDDVALCSLLLQSDYLTILKNKDIGEKIDSIGMSYQYNGSSVHDNETKLRMLLWIDVVRCYIGLNNQIDLNSKSGFGLFYLIVQSLGGKISGISGIPLARATYQATVESIIHSIKPYFDNDTFSKEEFTITKLLDSDTDQRSSYIVHLYRFVSIAAKADMVVSEQEAEWLASILKQKDAVASHYSEHKNQNTDEPAPSQPTTSKRTSMTAIMNELKELIGLASVKEEVVSLTNFLKIQQARASKGFKTTAVSYHYVFTGNPGTGKTTVARILAKIYKQLGVVSKGHLVETDRAGLVAEYVGQTAVKTNKIIDSALDGVLFIDEAYSLVQGGQSDYGKEAIATLLKRMEDDRDRLIVIIAGYTKEMKDFIDTNPGLQSRFNRFIEFPDYSADELFLIFECQAKKYEYTITTEAAVALNKYFEVCVQNKDKNFGNGRFARNVFEKTLEKQANRLARVRNLTNENLIEILPEDLPIN